MGMSASQARLLSLTSRLSDLELRAQVISNAKIRLADESTQASNDYENALDKQILKVENGSVNSDGSANFANANVQNIVSYTTPIHNDATNSKYRYITDASGKIVMSLSDLQTMYGYINNEQGYMLAMGLTVDSNGAFDTNSQEYKYYDNIYNAYMAYVNNSGTGIDIISDDEAKNSDWLSNQVQSGGLYLNEWDPNSQDPNDPTKTGAFIGASWTSGDDTMNEQTDSTETAQSEAKYEATMADINAKDKRFDLQLKNIDTEHEAIQTEVDSVKKVIDKNIERAFKMFQA